MNNRIKKIFLFLGLFVNQLLLPISVVAQEIIPTLEPTPTEIISPTPTETPTPTASQSGGQATPSPLPEDILEIAPVATESSIIVVVDVGNSATVDQTVTAASNSGENSGGQTNTGDAVAVGNIVNMVNSTSVDSSVKVYLLNSVSGEMKELDLNTLWKLLGNGEAADVTTKISNFAEITNQIDVTANSGGNLAYGAINTGDAYALANVINLINTNFIGSRVFVGVINIDAGNLGNIILPSPETFTNGSSNYGLGNVQISNEADINTISLASSDTGNNFAEGNNSDLNTGNAISMSNVSTMANFNLLNSSQMMLRINTLGNWTGSIYNWNSAGAVENGMSGMFISNGNSLGSGNLDVSIFNMANILNIVNATANTGNNSVVGGNSTIQTGNAYAIANVSNMANINIIGSDWFYGMINIIGDWNGDAIFAYPDMAIGMTTNKNKLNLNDDFLAQINFSNQGYDDANKVKIGLNLPEGISYVSDNSGKQAIKNGSTISWDMGDIKSKGTGNFSVVLKVNDDNQANKFVKSAFAADDYMLIDTEVSTVNTEVTLDNNNASIKTEMNQITDNNLSPKLVIDVKNNVNDFVYDGDVVTYQVDAKNEGEAKAQDTYIVHRIFDKNMKLVSQNKINVGDVAIGGKGKVSYGIRVESDNSQTFTTETVWIGKNENGDEVRSNISVTNFITKLKMVKTNISAVPQVQAVSVDGQVLGSNTTCLPVFDIIPFLLLFIISSLWILRQIKKWQLK